MRLTLIIILLQSAFVVVVVVVVGVVTAYQSSAMLMLSHNIKHINKTHLSLRGHYYFYHDDNIMSSSMQVRRIVQRQSSTTSSTSLWSNHDRHLLINNNDIDATATARLYPHPNIVKIAVIGGGASGMFAATAAAETLHECGLQLIKRGGVAKVAQKDHRRKKATNDNDPQQPYTKSTPSSSSSSSTHYASVTVLEATNKLMTKIKQSGGGRCNVLHDTNKTIEQLLLGYPRGKHELTGMFHKRFTPLKAQTWFESRGVTLHTEQDGRMFPSSNDSQTIIDVIYNAACNAGVVIEKKKRVSSITATTTVRNCPAIASIDGDGDSGNSSKQQQQQQQQQFLVSFRNNVNNVDGENNAKEDEEIYNAIILATGSSPIGYKLAQSLGHCIVKPVPSLFTFNVRKKHLVAKKEDEKSLQGAAVVVSGGGILHNLSGISLPNARITYNAKSESITNKKNKSLSYFKQEGPLLITHFGISGPAPLKLSAFAAREFHERNYKGQIHLHFAPDIGPANAVESVFLRQIHVNSKKLVRAACPLMALRSDDGDSCSSISSSNYVERNASKILKQSNGIVEEGQARSSPQRLIPRRLWENLCRSCEISNEARWGDVSGKKLKALSNVVADCTLEVISKNTFKDEFTTAGGVTLKDLDMTTMESKVCAGLYCCGELIDVDGITGGYNFMNCWATGYVAGSACVRSTVSRFLAAAAI